MAIERLSSMIQSIISTEILMCDTIGIIKPSQAFFAKNSDRSPNEPQVNEFYASADHPANSKLRATYLTIKQVKHTHAHFLSRPTWLWGGEMGVNEFGVCIGNEAVFTKGKYARTGLTGMDLVRLGLERGGDAREALEVIIRLLEEYGQGGNSGFDHKFFYDNSFLIMDRAQMFILETAGREWVYKQLPSASISNRLTIGTDGDVYSRGEAYDFKKTHFEPLYSHFSGSAHRLKQTSACLTTANNVADLMKALRVHREDVSNPLTQGSVASPCMHAGGLVGDHTTASMIAELGEQTQVWLTGSSTACISLFKPWVFGREVSPPVLLPGSPNAEAYWFEREAFHRQAIGHTLPAEFYQERDALEAGWISVSASDLTEGFIKPGKSVIEEEAAFYERWSKLLGGFPKGRRGFLRYWQKKNNALGKVRVS